MILLGLSGAMQGRKPDANRSALAILPAGGAVLLQAAHSHAASMYPGFSMLLLSQIIHISAAAIWLGTLVPLLCFVRAAAPEAAAIAARKYSVYGTGCVLLLALTALFQGWVLIANWPALIGTGYGWIVLLKLTLFALLLGCAARNRFTLTPALSGASPVITQKNLVRSIAYEAGFGLAIVIAAAFLAQLSPAIHEQTLWLFSKQPSLITINEDADFRREVIEALLALAFASALLVLAVFVRRMRWPLAIVAIGIGWLAVPHLDLLFIEAYPSSFYHSPTGFSAISIANGKPLYADHCAACHGTKGRGDGPAARGLAIPPADLTAPHLWGHSDGEMFWWLSHGIENPEGGQAMPGFADQLTEEQRWQLIDYIRANNAGVGFAASGSWTVPVKAPNIQLSCAKGTLTVDDLRGNVVRLIFADHAAAPPSPAELQGRLMTVMVGNNNIKPDETHCTANDPAIAQAYGVATGMTPDALSNVQFLIDTNGWLRAVQRPGERITNWNDPIQLTTDVLALCTHPLQAEQVSHAHHH
jgi:mono/diheme cytochrome c family protein